MKKLIALLLFITPMMNLQAQEYEESQPQEYSIEGTVTAISKDSILTIKVTKEPEAAPAAKQKVDVKKKFEMGNMKGTMGVADGQIISYANGVVKVQVLKYTSTMMQDGKRIPLIKLENVALLSWTMKPVPTYASEYKRAKRMMGDSKYDKAVLLLDSLINVNNKDTDAIYSKGFCYMKLEKYDAAVAAFNSVLELKPDHQMGHYMRAMAYARQEKYDKALPDIEFMMSQDLDEDDEAQILEDHIFLLDKIYKYDVDKAKLCKDYTRLCALDPDNMNYYNEKNRTCNTYALDNNLVNYVPVVTTFENSSKFMLTMQMQKKGKYKWYEKDHTLNKKIAVGTYVKVNEISEGMSMNIAIAKVISVEGSEIKLKIEYWSIRMNGEPVMYDLTEYKSDVVLEW